MNIKALKEELMELQETYKEILDDWKFVNRIKESTEKKISALQDLIYVYENEWARQNKGIKGDIQLE